MTVCTHTSQILIRGATTIEVFFFFEWCSRPLVLFDKLQSVQGGHTVVQLLGSLVETVWACHRFVSVSRLGKFDSITVAPSNPPARLHNCHYEYGESILSVCAF